MSPELHLFDTLARGVAIGALIAMSGAFLRTARGATRTAGVLFFLSIAAYAFNSSPALHGLVGPLHDAVHFMSLAGVGLFWLFVVALFEDQPASPRNFAPWALLTVLGLIAMSSPEPPRETIWIVHNLIETVIALHALYIIARSWRDDLVDSRRQIRGPFLAAVTTYMVSLSAFEIAEAQGYFYEWFRPLGAGTLALYCLAGAAVFVQARPALVGAERRPAPAAAPEDALALADRAAIAKLDSVMDAGAWRREGLTIGALADEVGVPEHRLRRLINDHLGHRNFAAFVNTRRVAAAQELLRDPAQAQRSVSAIAFDLGFGSLGPFNRAFKEATGQTPTEWRANGSPISENPG